MVAAQKIVQKRGIIMIGVFTTFIALPLIFGFWFPLSIKNADRKRKKDEPIRKGKANIWMLPFLYIMISGPITFLGFFGDYPLNFLENLGFGMVVFALPGLYLIPSYINVRITFENDYFVYRDIGRNIYKIPYESIRRYEITDVGRILIETDERKLRLPCATMAGIDDLFVNLELHVNGEKKKTIKMSKTEKDVYYAILIPCLIISFLMLMLYIRGSFEVLGEVWPLFIMGIFTLGIIIIVLFFKIFFDETYSTLFGGNDPAKTTGCRWKPNVISYTDITQHKIGKFFIILYVGKTKYRFFKAKMLHDELVRHGVV